MGDPRRTLLEIFLEAVRAVDGRRCVREFLAPHSLKEPVYLIAVGKAACAMARGAHEALGERIRDALIVTKEGHAEPLPWPVRESGHPLPDARSLEAGAALEQFIAAMPAAAHVLVLWSGGASALIECLPPGVDLEQWQHINDWLVGSGLDIHAINRVRKRLSLIKGGRLAQWLAPRAVTCLAISDVPGDDARAIGSGPLVADATLGGVLDIDVPDFVRVAFAKALPAPAPDDRCFKQISMHIVARLDDAKAAAVAAAERHGLQARLMSEFIHGEAHVVGQRLAHELAQAESNLLHVWGGETTVRLPPKPGRGGRNQALALAAAIELEGNEKCFLLAAGTDGTDGPTPDAGALVDGGTLSRGELHGVDAREALARADAGTFLEASGDLVETGPTGTNVMDLALGFRLP